MGGRAGLPRSRFVKSRIILRPGARADLAHIRSWYEEQRSGLGRDFLRSVDEALKFVARFPRSRPKVYGDVRRVNLAVFPHAIFYIPATPNIQVLAVQHQARITRKRLEELFEISRFQADLVVPALRDAQGRAAHPTEFERRVRNCSIK